VFRAAGTVGRRECLGDFARHCVDLMRMTVTCLLSSDHGELETGALVG